jgi:hypothetical protein
MEDNSLPPEVQEEVDRIKAGESEPEEEKPELVAVPDKPLSRRQQAAAETKAEIEAAKARADEATRLVEEIKKARDEDRERFARMEQALDMSLRMQHQPQQQQYRQAPPEVNADEEVSRLERERDKYLADGDLTGYNAANKKIVKIEAAAIAKQHIREFQASLPPPPQQQFQKPPWMAAVESQYGDVVMSPRGLDTVAAFMQMDPSVFGPEKLDKAFKRTREELGLSKRSEEKNHQARAMLAGGPSSSGPRAPNGKSGKQVKMPPGWQDSARRAGMSKDEYVRAYVDMHPEAVGAE